MKRGTKIYAPIKIIIKYKHDLIPRENIKHILKYIYFI